MGWAGSGLGSTQPDFTSPTPLLLSLAIDLSLWHWFLLRPNCNCKLFRVQGTIFITQFSFFWSLIWEKSSISYQFSAGNFNMQKRLKLGKFVFGVDPSIISSLMLDNNLCAIYAIDYTDYFSSVELFIWNLLAFIWPLLQTKR